MSVKGVRIIPYELNIDSSYYGNYEYNFTSNNRKYNILSISPITSDSYMIRKRNTELGYNDIVLIRIISATHPSTYYYNEAILDFGIVEQETTGRASLLFDDKFVIYGETTGFKINENLTNGGNAIVSPYTQFNDGVLLESFEDVERLSRLLINTNFINALPQLFVSISEFVSNVMYYPFNIIPKDRNRGVLEYGGIDTSGYGENFVRCYELEKNGFYNLFNFHIYPQVNNKNFTDYNGYCQIDVFLPFLGWVEVETNVIREHNDNIFVDLEIDYISGEGVYYISTGNSYSERIIISTKNVQLGFPISIGSTNNIDQFRNLIYGAVSVGTTALTGTPVNVSETTKQTTKNIMRKNPETGRMVKKGKDVTDTTSKRVSQTQISAKDKSLSTISSASRVLSNFSVGSSFDKTNNRLSSLAMPRCVAVRIRTVKPYGYNDRFRQLFGLPLGEVVKLGDLTGYTEIGEIHLEVLSDVKVPTLEEYELLENALYSGIIL